MKSTLCQFTAHPNQSTKAAQTIKVHKQQQLATNESQLTSESPQTASSTSALPSFKSPNEFLLTTTGINDEFPLSTLIRFKLSSSYSSCRMVRLRDFFLAPPLERAVLRLLGWVRGGAGGCCWWFIVWRLWFGIMVAFVGLVLD